MPALRHETAPVAGLTPDQIRLRDAIADLVYKGHGPAQIARKMAPNDEAKRKALRRRVRDLIGSDPYLAKRVHELAHAGLLIALGPTVEGLGRRAATGNPVAAKLILEATGLHNPKVQHDHTGEVKLSLSIPRPAIEAKAEDMDDVDLVD